MCACVFICLFSLFQSGLKLLFDVNRVERSDGIGQWPANHNGPFGRSNHFRYFVNTSCRPHGTNANTILQPKVL